MKNGETKMSRVLWLSLVALGLLACGSEEPLDEMPVGFFAYYSDSVCEEIEQVSAKAPSAEVHMRKDLAICRAKAFIAEGNASFSVFRFDDTVGLYRPQEVGPFASQEDCNATLETLRPFFGTTICTEKTAQKPFGF
jgi:hypothetical protein